MKVRNKEAKCVNCHFWFKLSSQYNDKEIGDEVGECRINPPNSFDKWATTNGDEWCGSHPRFSS